MQTNTTSAQLKNYSTNAAKDKTRFRRYSHVGYAVRIIECRKLRKAYLRSRNMELKAKLEDKPV